MLRLPVTARGVVTLVATNYGLFAPTGEGFAVRELAPGISFEAAQAATGAPLLPMRRTLRWPCISTTTPR